MILPYKQRDANWVLATTNMAEQMAKVALSYRKYVKLPDMQHAEWVTYDLYDGRRHGFPIGLWNYVKSRAIKQGYQPILQSVAFNSLPVSTDYRLPGITYEPYQEDTLRLLRLYKRGIVVSSTGSGKSVMVGGIIKRFSVPETLVVTINKTIFSQFKEDFYKWFPKNQIGVCGEGVNFIGHITLSTFQSLDKVDWKGFKLIILDEVQRVNDTIVDWLNRYGKNIHYRFGVTATPHTEEDNYEKAMQMHGYFGPIVKHLTEQDTISRVVPVKVYMVKFVNNKPTEKTYPDSLRHDILFNRERCSILLKAAKKLLLDKGLSCLVLLDEIEQARVMEDVAKKMGLNPLLAHSKNASGVNERIKKELDCGKCNLVIATQVFGIGTNIPNVDGVVLASSRKSEIDTLQKIGRGRRRTTSKDHLLLIDSIDQIRSPRRCHRHFYKYSLERMKIYEDMGWSINRLLTV